MEAEVSVEWDNTLRPLHLNCQKEVEVEVEGGVGVGLEVLATI